MRSLYLAPYSARLGAPSSKPTSFIWFQNHTWLTDMWISLIGFEGLFDSQISRSSSADDGSSLHVRPILNTVTTSGGVRALSHWIQIWLVVFHPCDSWTPESHSPIEALPCTGGEEEVEGDRFDCGSHPLGQVSPPSSSPRLLPP